MKLYVLIALALVCAGCKTKHAVIAHTGTMIGADLSENPANGLYHLKFGYARSELAYVPSNRADGTNSVSYGGGALDVAPVLMELRMANILKGGGIYQRLAVGQAAVSQPGAAFMFAKNADGTLSDTTAAAVGRSLQSIASPDPEATKAKLPLVEAYQKAEDKTKWNEAAISKGYASFAQFVAKPVTLAEVQAMAEAVKSLMQP